MPDAPPELIPDHLVACPPMVFCPECRCSSTWTFDKQLAPPWRLDEEHADKCHLRPVSPETPDPTP